MQTLLSRSLMWLFAEIVLTLLNLDDMADYGEFIFRVQDDLALQRDRIEQVLHSPADSSVYFTAVACFSA